MANIKYCESIDNYRFSDYIAEYFNTLSSLLFICIGLYGLCKRDLTFKYYFSEMAIIVVGIGSVIFHGNQSYLGEVLDEASMLLLVYSYFLHTVDSVMIYVLSFMLLWTVSVLYFYYNWYSLFVICFATGALMPYIRNHKLFNCRIMLLTLLVGSVPWIVEQYYYKNNMCPGQLYMISYYYHSIWHILSAITHRLYLDGLYNYNYHKIK